MSWIRVLYAEDDGHDADLTRARLIDEGEEFSLTVVGTGKECLDALAAAEFDVLLLDHHLPDMDGLDVLRTLARTTHDLPVVMVTGMGDEGLVVTALRLGASDYLVKRGDYLELLPLVLRGAIVQSVHAKALGVDNRPAPRRVLYVEHNAADAELTLRQLAEDAAHLVIDVSTSCEDALARLRRREPYDLTLIDLRMPGMSGLEFVNVARRLDLDVPPFIIVSGQGDDAAAIGALRLGALDYIVKRDGYLMQLASVIDHSIDFHRLRRLNLRLLDMLADRKVAEESLLETKARLRETIRAGNVGLWDWDLHSNRMQFSREWKAQIGHAEDEIPDRFEEWESRVHPEDLYRARAIARDCAEGRSPTIEQTFRFRHKDGTYRQIFARGAARTDANGVPVRILGSHVDITEQAQLQMQLLQSQKMESIGRLAGGVAHDFNNLLTVIISLSELASATLDQSEPAREDLAEIRRTGERAAALTRQLLAFSRRQVLRAVSVRVDEVVRDSFEMLRRLVPESIRFDVDLAPDTGYVRVDQTQLVQVLLNLVVNAQDAMPSGGALSIATRNEDLAPTGTAETAPSKFVVLSVRDTGTGMTRETVERIFEPFFTTKSAEKGTGLGLATAHGIVKQSGGEITVTSEVGSGTTFTVLLPRIDPDNAPSAEAPSVAAPKGAETILVVEDDETLRRIATRILGGAGYTVLLAATGSEGVTLLRDHPGTIDLLLTDVVLPELSGPEVAFEGAKLRPRMKILFTSGYAHDTPGFKPETLPASAFLPKPYSSAGLARSVRALLDDDAD